MQQIQQTQVNLNKCPHGFPVGTCPICSGHGGASKDKNKPRVAGEMSYNECMAAWIKIQAAKEARIQERIDKLESAREQLKFNRIMAGLIEKVNNIQQIVEKTIENFPPIIKAPVTFVVKVVVQIATVIINTAINITNFISSVSEKLASIYGEVKNFIASQIEKKIKKPLKIFLSLFAQSDEEDGEDREKVKKLLKSALKSTILKIKGKKKDERSNA